MGEGASGGVIDSVGVCDADSVITPASAAQALSMVAPRTSAVVARRNGRPEEGRGRVGITLQCKRASVRVRVARTNFSARPQRDIGARRRLHVGLGDAACKAAWAHARRVEAANAQVATDRAAT